MSPDDRNLFNYTLLPTHIYHLFTPEELADMELVPPLPFSKGCQVLKIRALKPSHNTYQHTLGDFLFDLQEDPEQESPIQDEQRISEMKSRLKSLMQESDAPAEFYLRYGLP